MALKSKFSLGPSSDSLLVAKKDSSGKVGGAVGFLVGLLVGSGATLGGNVTSGTGGNVGVGGAGTGARVVIPETDGTAVPSDTVGTAED